MIHINHQHSFLALNCTQKVHARSVRRLILLTTSLLLITKRLSRGLY
nr:MAG TPA: hypothetical protein [Caudoviricetes sp.]